MLKIFSQTTVGAIFALTLSFPVWADFTGKVVSIADGDTVVLDVFKVQHKVRLTGIDAPERTTFWQPFKAKPKQYGLQQNSNSENRQA